jgi:hypothetical protein
VMPSEGDRERADVVAWLRGFDHFPRMKDAAKFFAKLIEQGEHEGYSDDLGKEGK